MNFSNCLKTFMIIWNVPKTGSSFFFFWVGSAYKIYKICFCCIFCSLFLLVFQNRKMKERQYFFPDIYRPSKLRFTIYKVAWWSLRYTCITFLSELSQTLTLTNSKYSTSLGMLYRNSHSLINFKYMYEGPISNIKVDS